MKNLILLLFALLSVSLHAKQKNVLFIAVDDLKPMLGCYGVNTIQTPNIDKLANAGTIFNNAHCQQAVCSPSRASLMFGLRPDKTKVWDLKTPVRTAMQENKTVAQHFKDNGFETVGFGKIFHISMADKGHDALSWTIPYNEVNTTNYPKNTGEPFGHFQDPELKIEMQQYFEKLKAKGMKAGKAKNATVAKFKVSVESIDLPDDAYFDGQTAINGAKAIKDLAKKEKPFFVAVGFKKPHLPFVAPKKYWDLYNRNEIELSEWQKAPDGAPDLAMHSWGELKSYNDIGDQIKGNGLLKDKKQLELIHGYMASVSYIDAQIGMLLNQLEKSGVADETVIVLWGDHGWHLGDHGLWCKHSNFEQATRVPLIFSSPEIDGGILNSSPVEFVDIYPTLCDLADIPVPVGLDGVSVKPIMTGYKDQVKEFALSQYHRGKNMGYSMRTDRFRYTAWFEIDYRNGEKATMSKLVAEELYDYQVDPNETANEVENEEYKRVLNHLKIELLNFLAKQ